MSAIPTLVLMIFLQSVGDGLSRSSLCTMPLPVEEDPKCSTLIRLQRVDNLLLIEGTVDSVKGNFVFDTGAPGLVLNTAYFRDARPAVGPQGGGITGLNIERKIKRINQMEFGGLVYEDVYADVINLSHIENSKGIKILGLIGTAFIWNYEIILDTRQLTMQMYRVDRKGEYVNDRPDSIPYDLHQKTSFVNDVIISYVPIGGKKVCFCIDTGAESNVLDNHNHRKVLETVSVTGRSYLRGAGSRRTEVLHGIMNDFSVSECRFSNMKVVLCDLSLMRAAFGLNIKGMLGYDFLSRGIVRINLQKSLLSMALYDTE